ncbi:protein tyrosine phosphatase [Methylobacterium sp. 4-46]|uniref:tyrosine phosphatase family protein n=1 Tax=unclassified Methylobacterium TaxID=2615210 RepID=UPI000152E11D|nr:MULTISPECIES: protein-tyrosine-phosphatase [Methylobacterium]ACA20624.1 protein tyrosine phosphatase [Methylobacterium sp. 4-46]WFT79788.1 protein-tyrosine-phosphatase [Methylobacterium nodulans]
MTPEPISLHTVCGLEELGHHATRGVTHVLSILDPGWPEPDAFGTYDAHHRTTLRFHDIIAPTRGQVLPEPDHVAAILAFGQDLAGERPRDRHLLIHCHAGISRSTAAMTMLLAQAHPDLDEAAVVARVHELREKAWPNARMIAFADEALGRRGRLSEAVRRLHALQLKVRPHLDGLMRELGRGQEVDAALRG